MRLIQVFAKTALQNMKKVALITENNQLTYEDILHLVHVCDTELRSRGVKEGATIVLDTDRSEFYIIFCFLLSQRAYNVIFSRVDDVINADIDFDYFVTAKNSELVPSSKTIQIEGEWFAGLGTGTLPDYSAIDGERGSFIHASSGTTGKPKFNRTCESKRTELISEFLLRRNAPTVKTRHLSSLSITMGWAMDGYIAVLLAGGSAVALSDHRNKLLQYIDLYQVNTMDTTPANIRNIVDIDHARQYLASLKLVRVGGAYASDELLGSFTEIYDGMLTSGYGTTEIGGICNAIFDPNSGRDEGYIGEIYRQDLEISFFDKNLNLVEGATEGIVGFKFLDGRDERSYLNKDSEDEKSGYINGYFFPGDILRREGDSLYIIGRVKNIINLGGNKISLEAIQNSLEVGIGDGLFACVVVPDAFGLEQLVIFNQSENEVTLTEANHVLDQKFGKLQAIEIKKVDRMPLDSDGKIDIELLRNGLK